MDKTGANHSNGATGAATLGGGGGGGGGSGVVNYVKMVTLRSWRRWSFWPIVVLLILGVYVIQRDQFEPSSSPSYAFVQPKPPIAPLPIANNDPPTHGRQQQQRQQQQQQKQQQQQQLRQDSPSSDSSPSTDSSSPSTSSSSTTSSSSSPVLDGPTKEFMLEREKIYAARRKMVGEVCDRYGPATTYPSLKRVPLYRHRWLSSHRLIMCFNAKVGTTTWSRYLLNKINPEVAQKKAIHVLALKLLKPKGGNIKSKESLRLVQEFDKIMTVRHPFTRVVSAYVDKMLHGHEELRRMIIKNYRKTRKTPSHSNSSSSSSSSHSSSTSSSNSSSASITPPVHSSATTPTFEEFARYIVGSLTRRDNAPLKRAHGNIHWRPYYMNCGVCNLDYAVILKLETINEDTRYVSDKFNLGIEDTTLQHHKTNNATATTLQYFKTLPRDLILDLYNVYRFDFLMYNYTMAPYLPPKT